MLQHDISIGCLSQYFGFVLGIGLLGASEILDADHLVPWAIAVLMIACTFSIHRALLARESLLVQTYNLGRRHEREAVLR